MEAQAASAYRAITDVLTSEAGLAEGFASVLRETIFFRRLPADLRPVLEARDRAMGNEARVHRPAVTLVEQPPLDERAHLEILLHAIVSTGPPLRQEIVDFPSDRGCVAGEGAYGLRTQLAGEWRLDAGGLHGRGGDVHAQTLAMFGVAEELLQRAGMSFRDVVRTWIHLRDIDRDYADLNRARRVFFEARGLDPLPASTGIGGGPAAEAHDVALAIHAIRSSEPVERAVMTSPTLNEAPQYGADFARGMRVVEANKIALHVSGTASIDEAGRTAHPGDFEAQAERMLANVAAMLEGQRAGFRDVVSAITYLKHPADAARLRSKLSAAGYEGFPHALVAAPICRPELLCETEALAVLPLPGASPNGDA